eukprot:TRINITY_DN60672_c0_g1_i3.p1 TRINITY_DN60672_c0_g1~~TRINITY_DN60672_c0_g1_i3.p1  ORF type:complete len:974 (+),score=193.62 TRINITY_DN60672_c0_g1_i3:421-2922(+)
MKAGVVLQQQGQQEATIAMLQSRTTTGFEECNHRLENLGAEVQQAQQHTRSVDIALKQVDSKVVELKKNKHELALTTLTDQRAKQDEELNLLCLIQSKCGDLEKKISALQHDNKSTEDKLESFSEWKTKLEHQKEEEKTHQKQKENWLQEEERERSINRRSMFSLQRTGFGLDISHDDIMDACAEPMELNAIRDRVHTLETEMKEWQEQTKSLKTAMKNNRDGGLFGGGDHASYSGRPGNDFSMDVGSGPNRNKFALRVEIVALERQLKTLLERIMKGEKVAEKMEGKVQNNSYKNDTLKKRMSSLEAVQTEIQNCMQIAHKGTAKLDLQLEEVKEQQEVGKAQYKQVLTKMDQFKTKVESHDQALKFISEDVLRTNNRINTVHERLGSLHSTIRCLDVLTKSDDSGSALHAQLEEDEKLLRETQQKETAVFEEILHRHQSQQEEFLTQITRQQSMLQDLVELQQRETEERSELRKVFAEDREKETAIVNELTSFRIREFDASDSDVEDQDEDANTKNADEESREREDDSYLAAHNTHSSSMEVEGHPIGRFTMTTTTTNATTVYSRTGDATDTPAADPTSTIPRTPQENVRSGRTPSPPSVSALGVSDIHHEASYSLDRTANTTLNTTQPTPPETDKKSQSSVAPSTPAKPIEQLSTTQPTPTPSIPASVQTPNTSTSNITLTTPPLTTTPPPAYSTPHTPPTGSSFAAEKRGDGSAAGAPAFVGEDLSEHNDNNNKATDDTELSDLDDDDGIPLCDTPSPKAIEANAEKKTAAPLKFNLDDDDDSDVESPVAPPITKEDTKKGYDSDSSNFTISTGDEAEMGDDALADMMN